jgi:perosamine synthetase
LIPYSRQHIDEEDIKAVIEVLRSDWITQGPKIAEFEQRVAEYCSAKYAVAVSSGTAALHLACLAVGVGNGDEVITSPITFVASANCALYVGARPIFADIRPDTYCIDVEEIKKKITHKTKAIIPVDFAGHPCDMDDINKIAKENGLIVIEDAAHSLGAGYRGRKVGLLADMTIFSFHPVKHITTGEGGMIVTNNKEYYEKLMLLRSHGITRNPDEFINRKNAFSLTPGPLPLTPHPWYYEMQELGFNYRITDFQCALGISQMGKLDSFIKRRREIAGAYDEAFKKANEIIIPAELPECRSSYHLYPVQILTPNRDAIFNSLCEKGIGVNVHYIPVHLQPHYRRAFGYEECDFPNAERYFKRCVSLPIHQMMTEKEVRYVIDSLRDMKLISKI